MENETYKHLQSLGKGTPEQKAFFDSLSPEQQAEMIAIRDGGGAAPAAAAAEDPSLWRRIMDYEVLSPEENRQVAAFNTGAIQGGTFGYSEEFGSLSRALPGGETPQQYRDRQRAEQERLIADYPKTYLAGEVGGAIGSSFIPGLGVLNGPARGYQAATVPGRIAVSMGRGIVAGGLDAALQASGRGTGYGDRLKDAVTAAPAGMAGGAVAGPVFEVGLGLALNAISAKFGRTTTLAVERNVREIAERTGMSTDEVLRRVAAGQPLAGINDTTMMAARAIKNLSPTAGQDMVEAVSPRLDDAVAKAVDDVKTALVGPQMAAAPNLREAATGQLGTARTATGEALGAARAAAGEVQSPDTLAAILSAANRTPDVADSINTTLRLKGMDPLFKRVPGGMTFLRAPTIQEAEIITRELNDAATSAFRGAGGVVSTTRGEAFDELGTGIRKAVDIEAPQLGPLRSANAAAIAADKDAFPLGLVARSTAPDKFSVALGDLPPDAVGGARMGAATRIAEDVGRTRRDTSLIDEMMDPGRYLGRNIDTLAPSPVNRGPMSPLATAQNEGRLMDALIGNSTTAGQLQAMQSLQGVPGLQPVSKIGLSQPWLKLADVVQKVMGNQTGLDEKGMRALAQVMMQSGPEGQAILEKILKGSPLLKGETVSLGRMAAAAAGIFGGSDTMPAQAAQASMPPGVNQTILDILGAQ